MNQLRRIGRILTRPFAWLREYLISSVTELRHVTWPTRTELTQYTVLTLATIVVSVVVLSGIDYGLQLLSQRFLIR